MKKVALKPESGKYVISVGIHASSPLTDKALMGAVKMDAVCIRTKVVPR